MPPSFRWALGLLLVSACSTSGAFVWFKDVPRSEWEVASGQYTIGIGDAVSVRVYEQPTLATDGKIRSDGRFAVPFIGEVVAVGRSPGDVAREVEDRLKKFILNPRVTVNVESSAPLVISVLGEVARPGSVTLDRGGGLLEALAQAGGPSDFADRSAIFVLRRLPEFHRIRFTYGGLLQNRDGAALFRLRTGDVVVVQ